MHSRGWVLATVIAVVMVVCCPIAPARATVLVDPGLEELVRRADLVVHARVVGERCAIEDVARIGELPVTYTVLAPLRTLFGSREARVEVRELGGRVGARSAVIEGAARYRSGTEVVALLVRDGGVHRTVGMSLGVFHVSGDRASRDLEGAVTLAPLVEPASSLSELFARLERAIASRP